MKLKYKENVYTVVATPDGLANRYDLTDIGKQMLLKVADTLEELGQKFFDMDRWCAVNGRSITFVANIPENVTKEDCNTTMCIAGWLVYHHLQYLSNTVGLKGKKEPAIHSSEIIVDVAEMILFGATGSFSVPLFYHPLWDNIVEWDDPKDDSVEKVVHNLRKIVARGHFLEL